MQLFGRSTGLQVYRFTGCNMLISILLLKSTCNLCPATCNLQLTATKIVSKNGPKPHPGQKNLLFT